MTEALCPGLLYPVPEKGFVRLFCDLTGVFSHWDILPLSNFHVACSAVFPKFVWLAVSKQGSPPRNNPMSFFLKTVARGGTALSCHHSSIPCYWVFENIKKVDLNKKKLHSIDFRVRAWFSISLNRKSQTPIQFYSKAKVNEQRRRRWRQRWRQRWRDFCLSTRLIPL